jgi:TPR repeat protein
MADEYYKEALMWFQKAADQGNESGLRLIEKYNKYKSFLNDAEHGDSKAQYNLGIMYLDHVNGIVPPDIQEGISWLIKSGKQKNIEALIKLGDLYYKGWLFEVHTLDTDLKPSYKEFSLSKNYPEAVRYYVQAAELGNFYAQYKLGDMYRHGEYGLKTDYSEAEKWFLRAATHNINNPNSESDIGQYKPNKSNISFVQYELGQLYMRKEIGKDKEGLKWIRKAAENGSESAKRWLEYH